MELLSLKNITKEYPGVRALDNVSISFEKGEVHALIGENGAGKSTFIKTLSGAIRPTSGTIEFEGKTYDHLEPRQAIDLGIAVAGVLVGIAAVLLTARAGAADSGTGVGIKFTGITPAFFRALL